MGKYDWNMPFNDPVVRCDSCQALLRREDIRALGSCTCGNRKIRNLLVCNDEEMEQMRAWGIDPEFLAVFGPVEAAA